MGDEAKHKDLDDQRDTKKMITIKLKGMPILTITIMADSLNYERSELE